MFNDFQETNWPMKLPSKLYYITDRDEVIHFDGDVEAVAETDLHFENTLDLCLLYTSPSPRDS